MPKDMTIEEVKQRLIEEEADLTKKLKKLEEDAGVRVDFIRIERKQPKLRKGQEFPTYDQEKRQPIMTTRIDVDLDLAYRED